MFPDSTTSDREADEYELRLHRTSASRGFVLGGVLTGVGTLLFLLTGVVYIGMLLVPGILLLANAWTHRAQGNALDLRLRSEPRSGTSSGKAAARVTLERGARVLVTWTDGARIPGFVLQLRGKHYFEELEGGRQEWIPRKHVRPS